MAEGVVVGENCCIASGSTLMNSSPIRDRALVGLGSNDMRDLPASARVAGNPARELVEKAAYGNWRLRNPDHYGFWIEEELV